MAQFSLCRPLLFFSLSILLMSVPHQCASQELRVSEEWRPRQAAQPSLMENGIRGECSLCLSSSVFRKGPEKPVLREVVMAG